MQLYEYAVFYPGDKTSTGGRAAEIVVNPTPVLAANSEAAKRKAIRSIPSDWEGDIDSLRVLVREFSGWTSGSARITLDPAGYFRAGICLSGSCDS